MCKYGPILFIVVVLILVIVMIIYSVNSLPKYKLKGPKWKLALVSKTTRRIA